MYSDKRKLLSGPPDMQFVSGCPSRLIDDSRDRDLDGWPGSFRIQQPVVYCARQ